MLQNRHLYSAIKVAVQSKICSNCHHAITISLTKVYTHTVHTQSHDIIENLNGLTFKRVDDYCSSEFFVQTVRQFLRPAKCSGKTSAFLLTVSFVVSLMLRHPNLSLFLCVYYITYCNAVRM